MTYRTPLRKNAISRVVSQHSAVLLASATATALMMPPSALAQQLEEVIVTAQKREANLQDTALSVQVLGGERLQELNVNGFDDYIQFLPTVSFQSQRPGISQVYMRGIASGGDGNHSASMPSVGVYMDEQPITTINEILDLHMYDIARVETLSGPQGTLFGASSQAGTLRIITNKPLIGEFEAGYSLAANTVKDGDEGYTAEGFVNIPLGDRAALRLVGWYDEAAGYIDNVPSQITFGLSNITINNDHLVEDDFNDNKTTGFRALLKVDLNENWTITPGLTYQDMETNGIFDHDPDDLDELETQEFYDTFYDEEWYQASLTVEGRIGNMDLVYAGAYLDRDRDSQYDYTGFGEYYEAYVYNYEGGPSCYLYTDADDCADTSQYVDQDENWNRESHELRLQSSQDQRLRFIVGLFYQEQEHDFDLQWVVPDMGSASSLIPGGHTTWQTVQTRIDEDKAVFGEVSFDITENLTILGGARYYDYENSLFGFNGWYGRCTGFYDENGKFVEDQDNGTLQFPCYNTGVLDNVTDNSDIIGKFNLTYTFDDDKLIYLTWSEGYRAGGVNRAQEEPPYAEDFATNWEIGWKTSWMERRMRFNGAVYYVDWEDFQYNSLTFGSGVPLTVINNAGQADIYGFEFDMDYAVTNEFTASISGSYTDAETADAIDTADGPIEEGTTLPYVPEYQFSAILRYATQISDYDVYAQGAWSYTDSSTTDLRGFWSREMDSYNLVNLAIGVGRNNWSADLFVDNATDERAETNNIDFYPNYYVPVDTYYSTVRPRSIGVRFSQKF